MSLISVLYALIIVTAFLTALFAPTQLTALVVLATIVLLAFVPKARLFVPGTKPIVAGIAVLIGWSGISAFWSVDSIKSLEQFAQLLAVALIGWIYCIQIAATPRFERRYVPDALLLGFGICGAILVLEQLTNFSLIRLIEGIDAPKLRFHLENMYNRYDTFLVIIVFPIIHIVPRKIALPGARLAVFGIALLITLSLELTTSVVALLIAGAIYSLGSLHSRVVTSTLMVGTLATTILLPLMVDYARPLSPHLDPTALHRLVTWQFVVERIAERPWFGWGLDSARAIPGGTELVTSSALGPDLAGLPQWEELRSAAAQLLPLHPHNMVLQTLLELGIVGHAAFVFLLLALLGRLWSVSLTHPERSLYNALFTAVFIIGMSSFGVWQTWWLSAQIIAIGAALATVGTSAVRERRWLRSAPLQVDD